MKKLVLAALTLTACTPVEPMPGPGRPPMEGRCEAGRLDALIGREATPRLVARAKARAGASLVRVIRPGQPVTMDYRAGRLNISVDARNRVTRFNCG